MIDTAAKRRSASGWPRFLPGVTPTAAKTVDWRQASGWSYSGIVPLPVLKRRPQQVSVVRRVSQIVDVFSMTDDVSDDSEEE